MGLLSNIFGSDTEGAGGLLSGIGNALSENSNMLLGYGAGGAEGMMRGSLLDDNQRAKRIDGAAMKAGLMKMGLSEAEAAQMARSPTAANMYLQKLQQDRAQQNADRGFALQKEQFDFNKQQALAKQKPAYGVIGKDEFGNERYGWIDPYTQTTTPGQVPQQNSGVTATPPVGGDPSQPVASIPPAPPGVDPKVWRQKQTELLAGQDQPTPEMRNKLAAAEKVGADLKTSLRNYNEMVKKFGAEAWNGPNKARMQTIYTDLTMKMKEAANLGVLNGPDLELMQKQLEDATVSGWDKLNPFKQWGIGERVGAQTEELGKSVDNGLESARRAYSGKRVAPSAPAQQNGPAQVPGAAPKPPAKPLSEGATITNPSTGETRILRGNQWVPYS